MIKLIPIVQIPMAQMPIAEIKRGYQLGYKNDPQNYICHSCIDCHKQRWIRLRNGQPISLRCRSCAGRKGAWKTGRTKTARGYIQVMLMPDNFFYPMAAKTGYVKEHRLVVAQSLNRCLLSWEVVHHKNNIKDDNRIENLELLPSQNQHLVFIEAELAIKRLQKEVAVLQIRVTLLEAENIALRQEVRIA